MELFFSERFKKDYKLYSDDLKKIINSKLKMLTENPFHPSLRTKKIKGKEDIFETSISMSIRMTCGYYGKGILLRAVGGHDKTLKNP